MIDRRRFAGICLTIVLFALQARPVCASDALEKGFIHPPDSAKPHTWWHWMNGNITRQGITADLEAMKRVGLGGAQIFNVDCGIPAGPVKVGSDEWVGLVEHAVREASRLGLELCIHNTAGWSSSGGPWIKPDQAMQELVWTERKVHGPGRFSEVLEQPKDKEGFYRDVAVLAFRCENLPEDGQQIKDLRGKIALDRRNRLDPDLTTAVPGGAIPLDGEIDLTRNMAADGKLTWDVPEGKWSILRIGYRPTGAINSPAPPEATGLECDKLSKEGMDAAWDGMMGRILKAVGPAAGRSLNNALIDSYERGYQNWTHDFAREFAKRRGYDITPYLPVVTGRVVGSPEISERFLWDFRKTVAELWAQEYVGRFTELCHANGMLSSIEPYGNGAFDDLQCGGEADIAMGEFWVGSMNGDHTKMAASAMHTHGGKIVGAESFTADEGHAKWQADPYSIKALGDAMFCDGINRFIFHRYAHQPWMNVAPGMTMGPWGTNFERTVTWWNQAPAWLSYLSRCQFLLQSGLFVADVVICCGEAGANDLPGRGSLPAGYDYDGCDAGVVLKRMSVRNGRIVLPDGMSYRILVMPDSRYMTPEMVGKIEELVRAGAVVVAPKPERSPSLSGYPDCDARVRRLADQVWGNCNGKTIKQVRYGRGLIVWGMSLADVLRQMRISPDFEASGKSGAKHVRWIHRRAGTADVYFVANSEYVPAAIECTFRQSGKVPEFWHPDTGKIEPAPVYWEANGRTTVPIRFDAAGSVFVVFRKADLKSDHLVSVTRGGSNASSAIPLPKIVKATYGPPDDPAHTADVTDKVAAMVEQSELIIRANNDSFGDPARDIRKQLTVEYSFDGKTYTKTVPEGGELDLSMGRNKSPEFELRKETLSDRGGVSLVAWEPGEYILKTARGQVRRLQVKQGAATCGIRGPWTLRFPAGWGAPEQVTLGKLMSWTDHSDPGVRYFSGTARYSKDFELPAGMVAANRTVVLDLGRVKNFAQVTLNGKKLAVLWKEPFRIDVTGLVRAGRNHLEIEVTNLWPNRLIGDEQQPDDCEWNDGFVKQVPQWVIDGGKRPNPNRYTFATRKQYSKDSPLLESGLIGPVVVRSAQRVRAL